MTRRALRVRAVAYAEGMKTFQEIVESRLPLDEHMFDKNSLLHGLSHNLWVIWLTLALAGLGLIAES